MDGWADPAMMPTLRFAGRSRETETQAAMFLGSPEGKSMFMIETGADIKYDDRSDMEFPPLGSLQDKEQETECNAQNKFEYFQKIRHNTRARLVDPQPA
jgi:hypothetical protein